MNGHPVLSLFLDLAALPSPPRRERLVADRVIAELRALGLQPQEDGAGQRTGGDTGNIHAWLPPTGSGEPVLLCAHLDTIDPGPAVEPVVTDGEVRAAVGDVLGADNKAAVAAMLDGVRRLSEAGLPHGGVELLFTVQEELGLGGAACLEPARLRARTGYLYDIDGPIGGIVMAAPSHRAITLRFTGRAAHGSLPAHGANAVVAAARAVASMPTGQLEAGASVNVGTFNGGSALNVVADSASVALEVRSHNEGVADHISDKIVAAARTAAADTGCNVAAEVTVSYRAYRHSAESPLVDAAEWALRAIGCPPYRIEPRGGSDANILNAAGITCLNLACGMEAMHTGQERIAVADLMRLSDLTVTLVGGPL